MKSNCYVVDSYCFFKKCQKKQHFPAFMDVYPVTKCVKPASKLFMSKFCEFL